MGLAIETAVVDGASTIITALAAARALPHAVQVADRWYLMQNASRVFAEAVRQSMRAIRHVIALRH